MNEDGEVPARPRLSSPPSFTSASLRKRSHGYASSGTSSDAPFFSSDDLTESTVEHYESPQRKKQHRRLWWEDDPENTTPRKQVNSYSHRRAFDSGVFMASDSSSSSNEDGFNIDSMIIQKRPRRRALLPRWGVHRKPFLQGEEWAKHVVQTCLENDMEIVDLSSAGLSAISGDTLLPLQHLIRHANFHPQCLTDDSFQSLAPSLQIFLASNYLQRVPVELVTLTNLTTLSLRNNRITELPYSFGKLRFLRELNIASNKLRWLPFELLDLVQNGRLVHLNAFPNPFLKPSDTTLARTVENAEEQTPQMAVFLATSHITFYDVDGSVPRDAYPAPSFLSPNVTVLPVASKETPFPRTCTNRASGVVPSLFELALRACSKYIPHTEMAKYIPDEAPPSVRHALREAISAHAEGGRKCSTCQSYFITPGAEWIEYWHCAPDATKFDLEEMSLPFLRRTCTWKCARDAESQLFPN